MDHLTTYLGGESVAGELLKASSTWDGTNTSGFTALPAGVRIGNGVFNNLETARSSGHHLRVGLVVLGTVT